MVSFVMYHIFLKQNENLLTSGTSKDKKGKNDIILKTNYAIIHLSHCILIIQFTDESESN